jgi:PIN domain nuclease of toxin-antitoxin system
VKNEPALGYTRLYLVGYRTGKTFTSGARSFEDGDNNLLLSVASIWEMQIKLQLGKLKLDEPLRTFIDYQQQADDLRILPITIEHVFALDNLPLHHKDPFDRIIIAQANVEELFVVSKDEIFSSYPVKLIW